MKNNTIKLKLIKSLIGRKPLHRQIVKQLGLKKINSESVHNDNPAIRGLINKVDYMLLVEENA